jgi:hypothetical protein
LAIFINIRFTVNGQRSYSQWKPEYTEWYNPLPEIVISGEVNTPPSDAIILFDGENIFDGKTQKEKM